MSRDPTMNNDYSLFDTMQTEELEEILYQDSLLPEGERADPDLIWYIMEVLVSRQEKEGHIDDVDAAWKSFEKNYLPLANDPTPLYGDDDNSNSEEENTEGVTQSRSRKKRSLRTVWIAAAIIGILVLGSFSAYALGYDLWGVVASWTKETFGFSAPTQRDTADIPTVLEPLRDAIDECGVVGYTLPHSFPDGYQNKDVKVDQHDSYIEFSSIYVDEDSFIIFELIYQFDDNHSKMYEKNSDAPEEYWHNGIQFYIFVNAGQYTAVWNQGGIEYSLFGVNSHEELMTILDSI